MTKRGESLRNIKSKGWSSEVLKKGQVSLFLLLAIAIVLIIGLLLALKRPAIKTPRTPDLPPVVEPVQRMVERCLFESATAGLRLLGEQGGVIYKSQGGLVMDEFSSDSSFTFSHNGRSIWLSIFPAGVDYGVSCYPGDLPPNTANPSGRFDFERCPYVTFPFYGENSIRIVMGKPEGETNARLPDDSVVSNVKILNQLNLPGLEERDEALVRVSWMQHLLSPRMMVRANLAEFIRNNITPCLQKGFEQLARAPGFNLTPQGAMNAQPVFSENSTTIILKYPLKATLKATNQSTQLESFSASVGVRFGKIYKYVSDILREEAEDYSYNLSLAKPRDSITLEQPVVWYTTSEGKKVALLRFRDDKSKILNASGEFESYYFYGAIPNTPPAISYVHYRNLSVLPGFKDALRKPECGDVFLVNKSLDELSVRVFRKLNRAGVECIMGAYASILNNTNYRPAYDPDDDALEWHFKVSVCGWDQPCIFNNSNEFPRMRSELLLKYQEASNAQHYDIRRIPLRLWNYAPHQIEVLGCRAEAGFFVYPVVCHNWEDPHLDVLTLSISSPIPYHISGEDFTDTSHTWHVWFANVTGSHPVTFTCTDQFGASISSTHTIIIPC